MKIICFVKHAPDSAARIAIDGNGTSVATEGVDFNPSPFDEYGVEIALKTREALGEGEVIVASLGPDAAINSIRKALAMGCDRAIHVKTDTVADARGTGKALASAVKDENPDAVFFGYQAIDSNDGQVPAYVCQALGLPLVNVVSEMEIADGKATCKRQIEGAVELINVTLPAAFACTKGPNEPRFPSLPGIMKAKKKPVAEIEGALDGSGSTVNSLELPPQREAAKFVGEGVAAVGELVNRLKTEAKIL